MSCMEYKTVLRMEIPRLGGKDTKTALVFFKEILGEPSIIDGSKNGDTIYGFEYDGEFQPIYDAESKKWGLDLVISHKTDKKIYIESKYENGILIPEIFNLANKLLAKTEKVFLLNLDRIKLVNYEWCNRSPEPIKL